MAIGKKKLKTNVGGKHVGLSDNDKVKHDSRAELARDLGWSTGKVAESVSMLDRYPNRANDYYKIKNIGP